MPVANKSLFKLRDSLKGPIKFRVPIGYAAVAGRLDQRLEAKRAFDLTAICRCGHQKRLAIKRQLAVTR